MSKDDNSDEEENDTEEDKSVNYGKAFQGGVLAWLGSIVTDAVEDDIRDK